MKIKIREFKKSDRSKVFNLAYYLMKYEGNKDAKKQADLILSKRILPTLKNKNAKTFVAEADGEVVGFIVVEIRHSLLAAVTFLVVGEKYQKSGIGKKLMEYSGKYVKRNGIKTIQVMASAENKKAKSFYDKLGFEFYGYTLRKKV